MLRAVADGRDKNTIFVAQGILSVFQEALSREEKKMLECAEQCKMGTNLRTVVDFQNSCFFHRGGGLKRWETRLSKRLHYQVLACFLEETKFIKVRFGKGAL